MLLPALAVLVAIPAGYPDTSRGEPLPIWFGLAFLAPVGVLLIAVGVTLAKGWARTHGSAPEAPG